VKPGVNAGSAVARGPISAAALWGIAVFLLCLLAALVGSHYAQRAQEARDQARLQRYGEHLRSSLIGRFADSEDFLLASRGLEVAGGQVGAKAWEAFTGQFEFQRHPGMKTLARIVRVPKEELAAFHARGLKEGILYNIRSPKRLAGTPEDLVYVPAAEDSYLIRYAAPQAQNTLALGLDVGRNPVQRKAADRARDSGRQALSGKLLFNDLGGERPAVALFLPLYRGGIVPATEAERRQLSDGWLSVALLVDDTFTELLKTLREGLAVEAEDISGSVPVQLWVDPRLGSLPNGYQGPARFEEIKLAGRVWRLRIRALPAFMDDGGRSRPAAWIAGGGLLGIALALAVWSLAGSRARAYALAQHLTRATREALQRFETLMENVPLGVIDWDADLRVREWNPAASGIFGKPAASALGRNGAELGFPGPFQDSLGSVLAYPTDGAILQGSGNFPAPGGGDIHCEWTHTPLRDPEGRAVGVTTILEDVTGRRQEEEALRLSQKLESLGVLAGGIAHDFNNLLLGISGNTELALLRSADGELRGHLDRVLTATRRASELARQMLAYAGRAPFHVRPLDLNAQVREILDLLQASLPKIVNVQSELHPDPLWIEGDVVQIHQVLVNLVTNGAEAVGDHPGSVRISTAAVEADEALLRQLGSSSALATGPSVRLTVEDDGAGMQPVVLRKIFDPFFTTKFTGRGLGLSSVLGILKAHKGGLSVTSQVGRGSTFHVYFPRVPAPLRPELDIQQMPVLPKRPRTVLFADDEPTLRELAEAALGGQGHRVLLAADGLEAFAKFEEAGHVDVVVLDLTMPRMGGLEAFRLIRELQPSAKVILSSGYTEFALDEAMEPRPNAFLHKPYRIPELLRKIEELSN
jgi:PAS domain S-box-containing protein